MKKLHTQLEIFLLSLEQTQLCNGQEAIVLDNQNHYVHGCGDIQNMDNCKNRRICEGHYNDNCFTCPNQQSDLL